MLGRISALRRQEPWPGYDELTVAEIETALGESDEQRMKDVAAYERAHKNRTGVLRNVQRETANAWVSPRSGADAQPVTDRAL